jgi:hypothetical protein
LHDSSKVVIADRPEGNNASLAALLGQGACSSQRLDIFSAWEALPVVTKLGQQRRRQNAPAPGKEEKML